ncbi:MAG: cadherin-like domain-containing protein [Actinomycetota bacterium]
MTATVGSLVLRASDPATASSASGYWLAGVDGGVFGYGQAPFYGSAGAAPLNSPIVGFVPTPSAAGYWMVAGDGGIFAFGDAPFLGSMGGQPLNRPISSMAATLTGKGYWLLATDGGIFAFGDAPFFGSLASENLSKPVVDMASTPTGKGYWMTTSDGQVYGFGDAAYYGSVGAVDLNKRIQALAPTPSGHGYWLVAADGGIFAFGDAGYFGAASGQTEKRAVDMAATATGRGYYIVTANGQVFPFGDATSYGDASTADLNNKITAIAAVLPPSAGRPGAGTGIQAVDDIAEGKEDAPINLDVLANDKPPAGGGSLTLQSVNPPAHGRAQVAGNRVAYEPTPDYHGPDSFVYTVTDGSGATSTGTVQLTVTPVNDKPEAIDDEVTITDGGATTVDVVTNDKGLGDGLKAVSIVQGPAHGQAVVQPDHKIAYTPANGFNGDDGFEYRVTDVEDESSTGKVKITIGGANHLPNAVDDSLTTRSGRQAPIDVTSNDDVADGVREIRFTDPSGAPLEGVDTTTQSGGYARRDGTKITYTAPAGTFTGNDSFSYVVVDNNGDMSKPAVVRANVVRNQPPQVKDGTVDVPQNRQAVGSIAKLGWDPEKDAITFTLRSSPAGQLRLEPDGRFLYQAPSGVDVDGFSFVVSDGNSESDEGHLNIQITDAQSPTSSSATSSSTSSSTTSSTSAGSWSSTTSTTDKSSTTSTTRKSSTTSTTERSSSTSTTGRASTTTTTSSETTASTSKSSAQTKSKKQSSSNNRGKSTSSSKSKNKGFLIPLIPMAAAAPVITRRRRRRRRARG